MNKEEMRKAFEEWINATTNYLSSCWVVFDGNNGRYREVRGSESDADRVSFAFYAWQARQPEIDQLKELVYEVD